MVEKLSASRDKQVGIQSPKIETRMSLYDLQALDRSLKDKFVHGLLLGEIATLANSVSSHGAPVTDEKLSGQILTDSLVPLGGFPSAYFCKQISAQFNGAKTNHVYEYWTNGSGEIYPFVFRELFDCLYNLGPKGLYIADSSLLRKTDKAPSIIGATVKAQTGRVLRFFRNVRHSNPLPYVFVSSLTQCDPITNEEIAKIKSGTRY